jgi:sterol desaturase/sphingolipid hydroxylase (fatty acid hydroxylase superfamily)
MKEHKSIRVFKSDFLEKFTHVHPIVPLLFWTPIIGYWLYQAATISKLSALNFLVLAIVGLFLWSLTEYILHRFIFHYPAKSTIGKRFIFLFHGIHHDDPSDPTRLVMPPLPAVFYIYWLYQFYSLLVPEVYMSGFMAFFMMGYLCYDYIHYATHHFKMNNRIGRYIKKWHLVHHHAHEASKYGVSSPLWDFIFRSVTGPKETASYAKASH